MNQQLMIIGDIHGQFDQAAVLLDSPEAQGRRLVFVGDLIDRGPHSARVLDLVCDVVDHWPAGATVIRGNHEQALLDFLDNGDPSVFLRNGGLSTVASYYRSIPPYVLSDFRETFPHRHYAALRNSELCIETSELLVSHMGFDPERPGARDLEAMVLEPHPELFTDVAAVKKLTICGHYAQRSRRPYVSGLFACIDTGCGTFADGPLSAYLLPERTILGIPAKGGV